MIVVDAQVHPFAADTPERPWAPAAPEAVHLPSVTGAQMVAAMEQVGVDRAIAVSPVRVYGWDAGYAEEVYRDHPDRFRLVTPVDVLDPRAVSRITQWSEAPGAAGIRMLFEPTQMSPDDPMIAAAVHAAVDADLTINISCWGRLEIMEPMAKKFPEARFALDHLGMRQAGEPPAPEDPFAEIETVLALATYPNVTIKVTGACTVSHEAYPYADLWEPVGRILDAFGVDRCMWGTDWTRATRFLTYEQGLSAFRDHWPMSEADKEMFLGGTALRVYNWDRH